MWILLQKILKHKNVFLNIGMYAFVPVINECDIYSTEDYNLKLSNEEFEKYANEKERVFGILIKKESEDYIIGSCDLCGCSIDATFKEIEFFLISSHIACSSPQPVMITYL